MISPRLPIDTVAQKLGDHGHPESLHDFEYTADLLVALGIRPGDFDLDLLPAIQTRAVGIAQRRVAAERKAKQAETMLAVAFGVIIAILIHTLPAQAGDGPIDPETGAWIAFAIGAGLIIYAIARHFRPEPPDDTHDDVYGDVPARPYGRPE